VFCYCVRHNRDEPAMDEFVAQRGAYPRKVAQRKLGRKTCQLKRRSAVTVQGMGYFWIGTGRKSSGRLARISNARASPFSFSRERFRRRVGRSPPPCS
jgi:hypothetical protein